MLTVLTNFSIASPANPLAALFPGFSRLATGTGHASLPAVTLLAVLALLPVLLAVWVAGKYLRAEPDEFIRALVVRALLWGFAAAMAGNAVAGTLMDFYGRPFPIVLLNADLFFATSLIAFRLLQRRYR